MTNKQFANWLMRMLELFPEQWIFNGFTARFRDSDVCIWVTNRPYGDLSLYHDGTNSSARIGTYWQRRKLRKMLDGVEFSQAVKRVETKIIDTPFASQGRPV